MDLKNLIIERIKEKGSLLGLLYLIYSSKRQKRTRKESKRLKHPLDALPLQFHRLTGRKLVSAKNFWKELQSYIHENEKNNLKFSENNMVLEAQLSSAQDDFEKMEKALLEISNVYDKLVDRNTHLTRENKQIYAILKNIPFDVWKKFTTEKFIELSVSSQSDCTMNSRSTKKNSHLLIEEETNI